MPGIEPRFRALAQQTKADPDYATLKPAITAVINGTAVDLGWNWGGYRTFLSLCEMQVDRAGDSRVGEWSNPVSVTVGG